jgi:hypothetical protein
MGCHTWYKKLITNNQETIVGKIKDVISISRSYNWYEFTSLEDLFNNDEEWVQEIAEYVSDSIDGLIDVDGVFGIYESANGFDTDEPRIGGYPETIIKSADEMFKVMETGLVNWEGKHFHFRWEKEREDFIRDNIIKFFEAHPGGIIEFG